MKRSMQSIAFAREASMTKRCHTFPIVGEYTTGLHSYNALSLYLLLCPEPTMAVVWELQFHDSGERAVGDMPAPAKKIHPNLGQSYEEAEAGVRWKFGLSNPYQMTDEDTKWINACDKLEFLLFCRDQRRLGNHNIISREATISESLTKANLPKEAKDFFLSFQMNGFPEIRDDEI